MTYALPALAYLTALPLDGWARIGATVAIAAVAWCVPSMMENPYDD